MFVCGECFVLSGRGLCDELITRPGDSYRLWCVGLCDLETSRMRRSCPVLGLSSIGSKNEKQFTKKSDTEDEKPGKFFGPVTK